MNVTPGDVFVCKSTTEAFVEPKMALNTINEEALENWETFSLSFEAWPDKFLNCFLYTSPSLRD